MHGFGDDQRDVALQAIAQALVQVRLGIALQGRVHPNLIAANVHVKGAHVVSPQIKCAAAGQIKTGMMPVTGQDAIFDAAVF